MRKAHLMESIQAWIEKFIEQAQQKSSQSTINRKFTVNMLMHILFNY